MRESKRGREHGRGTVESTRGVEFRQFSFRQQTSSSRRTAKAEAAATGFRLDTDRQLVGEDSFSAN